MAQPALKDARPVDPVLSSLSLGFKNDRFIWDKVAPPVEVAEQSGTYFIWTKDFWMRRLNNAMRSPEGPYQRVGMEVSTSTYAALERGFEKVLGDVIVNATQIPDLPGAAVEFLTNLIQLELEKDVAAGAFVTGVWGTTTTLSGSDQWSDFANSNPISNAQTAIRTIKRNTGTKPNRLIVGLLAWEKLADHPLIIERYKHTQSGIMTEELVAAALGVDELVVGDSVENSAAEGATYVGADIWTDNALFVATTETPGRMVANGAYTFVWNERNNVPWAVERYRDETVRGDVARVFTHYDVNITSSAHGMIFLDTVA